MKQTNLITETVNFLNRGLEEQFKGFKFSIGNEKPSTYSEKDIDEFLDNPNTSADDLPKWLANGIMVTLGAKNIKGH